MAKPKRKLSKAEKLAKKERKRLYQWVFNNGKQKRIKRPPASEEMSVNDFIVSTA